MTMNKLTLCGALMTDKLYPNCNEDPAKHTIVVKTKKHVTLAFGDVFGPSSPSMSTVRK